MPPAPAQPPSLVPPASEVGALRRLLQRFTVLRGAVRELWIIFGTKLLTILAYGVMNSTLVLWLSSDLGYTDIGAGSMVAIWSTAMTLCTVVVGSLVDAIGLRKAFLLGVSICFVARGVMTFADTRWLALGLGLFPLAAGEALLTPVMVAAVRRYATTAQRSIAFSIFYAMMNVGFAFSNFTFDYFRQHLGEHGHLTLPVVGIELTTYRTLFFTSFLLTIPNLLLFYFCLREGVEATDEGVKITPAQRQHSDQKVFTAMRLTARDTLQQTARIFAGLWQQTSFYKFLVFLSLVVAVRLIFYHMHYTYPKFGIRELGQGAPIGRLWAINAILIIFLVPLVGALTQRFSAYRMVMIGSFISGTSVFLMALPPEWFRPLADGQLGRWLGHGWLGLQGEVNPYYISIFLYVVVLSVGEALWSPRLYEYTAAIAPKGQEASYMSLSYLPYFVAKFFVGMFSGFLLARYCPESGARHSEVLWLIIALTTMITPVGLLVLRPYIRVPEAGRDEK
jgi:MFS family permease